jgi:hypothetical protein
VRLATALNCPFSTYLRLLTLSAPAHHFSQ